MTDIKGILERADEAKPIAKLGDRDIYSFDDYRSLATQNNMEEMMGGKRSIDGLHLNPDGSLARTNGNMAAVNLDDFYANRYKKVKNKYYVVTDLMAIDGAKTGKVPYPQITGYLIGEKDGKVVCEKTVMVSDKDFVADFTHTLDRESMKLVLEAIASSNVEQEAEKLEF